MTRDTALAIAVSLLLHGLFLGGAELMLRTETVQGKQEIRSADGLTIGAGQRIRVLSAPPDRTASARVSREDERRRDLRERLRPQQREARPSAARNETTPKPVDEPTGELARELTEELTEPAVSDGNSDAGAEADFTAAAESTTEAESAVDPEAAYEGATAPTAAPALTPVAARAPATAAHTSDEAAGPTTAAAAAGSSSSPSPENREPRLAAPVAPDYPLRARRLGHEGTVEVRVMVAPTGEVLDAAVAESSGHSELDEAARRAAESAPFVPASRPTPVAVVVRVVFRLE